MQLECWLGRWKSGEKGNMLAQQAQLDGSMRERNGPRCQPQGKQAISCRATNCRVSKAHWGSSQWGNKAMGNSIGMDWNLSCTGKRTQSKEEEASGSMTEGMGGECAYMQVMMKKKGVHRCTSFCRQEACCYIP